MKKLLFLLLTASFIFAQDKNEPFVQGTSPRFNVDIMNTKSSVLGIADVNIFFEMPYGNLQFIKGNDEFQAKYSMTVLFYDKDQESILKSDSWDETLKTPIFGESISNENSYFSQKTYSLKAGKYFVKCMAEDANSKKTFLQEISLIVPDFSENLSASDIILVKQIVNDKGEYKILPNLARNSQDNDKVTFYYEVFSESQVDINIEYRIFNKKEELVYSETFFKSLAKGKNAITQSLINKEFKLGEFILNVVFKDIEGKSLKVISKNFISQLIGLPYAINNLDEAIKQLLYIAAPGDISFIQDADSFEERVNRFRDYWKKQDPSPGTDKNELFVEYYKRVAFANTKFKGVFGGYRSDMGMIYITLGPPDNIDRQPVAINSNPYEVWSYSNIGQQFVFIDISGFGDFRLQNYDYRWSKFRY